MYGKPIRCYLFSAKYSFLSKIIGKSFMIHYVHMYCVFSKNENTIHLFFIDIDLVSS